MQVGFVGVGAMGAAMAGHVAQGGHEVRVFDLDSATMEKAAQHPGVSATDTAGIADCATVIIVVATDDQSRTVVADLLDRGAQGILVIAGTNHPRTMIDLAAICDTAGAGFVDAPVCFGLKGAIDGDLVSLCGGEAAHVETIRPVLDCYSRAVEHLGPVGCGQLGKTCNNMMHWAACVANYEVLSLAKSCGIDAQRMRETLLKCPARNTTLERWDTTRLTWHAKDMDVALDLSQQAGLSLPLFGMVDQLVKRLGPDGVKSLLYGDEAEYLGQRIAPQALSDVTRKGR